MSYWRYLHDVSDIKILYPLCLVQEAQNVPHVQLRGESPLFSLLTPSFFSLFSAFSLGVGIRRFRVFFLIKSLVLLLLDALHFAVDFLVNWQQFLCGFFNQRNRTVEVVEEGLFGLVLVYRFDPL